jgi:coniferyl-aldehyde dehydrogenase
MTAAAENLTPVTLELGGKCPAIVSRGADLSIAATRIIAGKTLNAGQTCLAPDYVLLPREHLDAFVAASKTAFAAMFPKLRDNPDYTAIINRAHFDRLCGLMAEARGKIVTLNQAGEDLPDAQRKMALTLIIDPPDDSALMREEIFGPLLPIKPYDSMADAIAYVNARPIPLALYYFGEDHAEAETVLARTRSGGVTINDVLYHVAQEELPFGGLGPSGMGRYHGREGFLEFSHQRGIYRQIRSELIARLRPPYGERFRDMMKDRLKD